MSNGVVVSAFLDEAPHVQVPVVGAPVGELVDDRRVAVRTRRSRERRS